MSHLDSKAHILEPSRHESSPWMSVRWFLRTSQVVEASPNRMQTIPGTSKPDESQPTRIQSWITATAKNSALYPAVLATAASQLLGVIRDDHALDDAREFQRDLLSFASYCAILVNVIATAASLFMHHPPDGMASEDTRQHHPHGEAQPHQTVLQRIASQCNANVNVALGMMFIILQVLVYAWVRKDLSTSPGPT
ncbi:hypothetical protein B0H14DRAFT_2727844 [Mycena olivaceomarginata]|nr:hypothetical protein B0H14DRAFT_2727844 [Mycena olivaceomarginata]